MLIPAIVIVSLGACDFNPGADRSDCQGYPEIVRVLPDTSIQVNSEPLIIDVEGDVPVARHTAGHGFHFEAGSSDPEVAMAYIAGWQGRNVLMVVPQGEGEAKIGLVVTDFCDKQDNTYFTIRVSLGDAP